MSILHDFKKVFHDKSPTPPKRMAFFITGCKAANVAGTQMVS